MNKGETKKYINEVVKTVRELSKVRMSRQDVLDILDSLDLEYYAKKYTPVELSFRIMHEYQLQ